MTGKGGADASVAAGSGSIVIGGVNHGPVSNYNAQNLIIQHQIDRVLPSYLSRVIAKFSADLSDYDSGPQRALPPEVSVKLAFNDFPPTHPIISDYVKYANLLEASYRGVEQRNDDARRLVRRRAGFVYSDLLQELCTNHQVSHMQAGNIARNHSVPLVMSVVNALLTEFSKDGETFVMQEVAHLAVCLVVADAVIECDVLQRPDDATAP